MPRGRPITRQSRWETRGWESTTRPPSSTKPLVVNRSISGRLLCNCNGDESSSARVMPAPRHDANVPLAGACQPLWLRTNPQGSPWRCAAIRPRSSPVRNRRKPISSAKRSRSRPGCANAVVAKMTTITNATSSSNTLKPLAVTPRRDDNTRLRYVGITAPPWGNGPSQRG